MASLYENESIVRANAAQRARRGRSDQPSIAIAGWLHPAGSRRNFQLSAAGLPILEEGRGYRARGEERHRRAGNLDARRSPGGTLERNRAMVRHRLGNGPLSRQIRARHGVSHDTRGSRGRPGPPGHSILPAVTTPRVPDSDEMARRSAPARRTDPRPRVYDER